MRVYEPDGSLGTPISLVYRAGNSKYLCVSNQCFFFCPKRNKNYTDAYELKNKRWSRIDKFIRNRNIVGGCIYDLWTGDFVWCAQGSKKNEGYYGVKPKYRLFHSEQGNGFENATGARTAENLNDFFFLGVFDIDLRGNLYVAYAEQKTFIDEEGNEKYADGDSKIVRYDGELRYQREWKDKVIKVRYSDASVYAIEMSDSEYKILKWSERH